MKILAFFVNSNIPATGLNPTIRIRDLSDNSLVITDGSMSEVGDGHYVYDFTTYDLDKDYAIRCDGGGTLPSADRYTYAGNENYINDIENSNLSTQIVAVSAGVDSIQADVLRVDTRVLSVSGDMESNFTSLTGDIANVNSNVQSSSDNIDIINTNVLAVSASLVTVQSDLKRVLGLMHENIYIDNPVFDGDGNMTAARVRIYSAAGSVGTASDVIGTYEITAPGDGPGKFTSWKQVKV